MKISLDNYNLMEMIICLIWLYLHTHYFPIKIHSSPKFISLSNCGVGPEQVAIVCLIKLIVILKEMNEHLMKNWLKSTDKPKEHPFNSSSERSIKLNSSFDIPGPGTYNPPLHDIEKTSKYHITREKKYPIQREFLWMFGSQRDSGLNLRESNVLVGPGAYDVKDQQKMLQCSWSKASRFKTSPQSASFHSPGPGYYQSTLKTETSAGAQFVFKSKLKKSIEFSQKKPKESPKEELHHSDIEEDCYESQKEQAKRSLQKSSVFASKVPRFTTQSGASFIGPGAYHVQNSVWQRERPELPKVVRFKPSKAPMFREKAASQIGPGSYNMNKYTFSRELQFKGCAISRETRFNFSGKKSQHSSIIPGPGSYMQNKYVYLNEKQISGSRPKKVKTAVHLPEKVSMKEENAKQLAGPGCYNLNSYDIEFRMRKRIEHSKKLKLMEISVPGFNSKVPRLQ